MRVFHSQGRLRNPSYLCVFLALAFVFACAGCDAGSASGGITATPFPTDVLPPYQRPPLSAQAAWGKVVIHAQPSAQPNNYVFVFENAATPDEQWLVGLVMPRDLLTDPTRPSFLALLNVNTGAIQTIAQLRSPQSAVRGVSADDTWVVWSEADDPPRLF